MQKRGADYVERNILYANAKAKKNYRVYLLRALKEDWGASWWEEQEVEQAQEVLEQESRSQGYEALKQQAREELAYYQELFLSLTSPEELEKLTSYIEEKVSREISPHAEDFEYHKDIQLASLLREGAERYQRQAQNL